MLGYPTLGYQTFGYQSIGMENVIGMAFIFPWFGGQLPENKTFAGALCFFLRESSGHSGCLLLAPREGWWPGGHQHIVYPGARPTHCLPGGLVLYPLLTWNLYFIVGYELVDRNLLMS